MFMDVNAVHASCRHRRVVARDVVRRHQAPGAIWIVGSRAIGSHPVLRSAVMADVMPLALVAAQGGAMNEVQKVKPSSAMDRDKRWYSLNAPSLRLFAINLASPHVAGSVRTNWETRARLSGSAFAALLGGRY